MTDTKLLVVGVFVLGVLWLATSSSSATSSTDSDADDGVTGL
jgi:hypothetical protein